MEGEEARVREEGEGRGEEGSGPGLEDMKGKLLVELSFNFAFGGVECMSPCERGVGFRTGYHGVHAALLRIVVFCGSFLLNFWCAIFSGLRCS